MLIAVSCLISSPIAAQTIMIDSTFTTDGEIFPFEPGDTIYGLSISGSVILNCDTSLVRVILTDEDGNEWMVYEAYPMIVNDSAFEILEECDETCFLDDFIPYSIEIQIINSDFHLDSLNISEETEGDPGALQFQSKRFKDLEKLQIIIQNISLHGWEWNAGDNNLLAQFYSVKTRLFGYNKFNVQGYDYYLSGRFEYFGDNFITNAGSVFTASFDWRTKHNADINGGPYYNPGGFGWITALAGQGDCGSC